MWIGCTIFVCFVHFVAAVFQDEAGVLDKHIASIGCPKELLFHEPAPGQGSICYALTYRNVLAALHCRDGTILWRYMAPKDSSILNFKATGDSLISVLDDGSVQSRSAYTGRILWIAKVVNLTTTKVAIAIDETFIYIQTTTELIALTKDDGHTEWTSLLEPAGIYPADLQLLSDDTSVFSVINTGSGNSSETTIRLWDLNATIEKSNYYTVCQGCVPLSVIHEGAKTVPFVITRELRSGKLTLTFVSTKVTHSLKHEARSENIRVQSAVLEGLLVILIQYTDADLFTSAHVHSFSLPAGKFLDSYQIPAAQIASTLALALHKSSVIAARVVIDDNLASHVELWAANGKGLLQRNKIEDQELGDIGQLKIRAEASMDSTTGEIVVRAMLATSTCEVFMWHRNSIAWTRPEMIADAKFVMLSLPSTVVAAEREAELQAGQFQSLYNRLRRHVSAIVLYASNTRKIHSNPDEVLLLQDHFGLRQYVIGFSDYGVFAIDTIVKNGFLWLIPFPISGTVFTKAWHLNADAEGISGSKIAVLVQAENRAIRYHLNTAEHTLTEVDSWQQSAAVARQDSMHDSTGDILFVEVSTNMAIARKSSVASPLVSPQYLWEFVAPIGSRIAAKSLSSQKEQIASVGRVLGDRGVLYKHLPGFLGLVVVNDLEERLTVFLLSSVDGRIIHQASHWHVGTTKEVRCVQSENWFVYHFWSGGEVNAYQMGIVELFEGTRNIRQVQPNDDVNALTRSFIYDHEIVAMAVTTTMQGITTRDVVVSLRSGELALIPRRLLDPRRPATDKLTSADKEEFLPPYESTIVLEPRALLSHTLEVLGVENIAVSSTLLESTGLVCAYGLDVFITRVTPSMPFDTLSDSFSKAQIILSLTVMIVAIITTRPFASRKSLGRKWLD